MSKKTPFLILFETHKIQNHLFCYKVPQKN